MKKLNELYNTAINDNIFVKKMKMDKEWKGHCIYDLNQNCAIFLNNSLNTVEEKCTLAHELGHYKTGILQNNILSSEYRDTLLRSINDFRANKWAVKELIPFPIFKSFVDKNMSKFDVAKELEVTEDLINYACYIYEPYLKN